LAKPNFFSWVLIKSSTPSKYTKCVHSKYSNYRIRFAILPVQKGAMTDKLPPHLLNLFTPRPPLRYLLPGDTAPEKRQTATVSGLAAFLTQINKHDQNYIPTDTAEQQKEKRRATRQTRNQKSLRDTIENCMFPSQIVAFCELTTNSY
jgi:U1 small nuclear ribonucleoprotein of 70kDa MW N terminal